MCQQCLPSDIRPSLVKTSKDKKSFLSQLAAGHETPGLALLALYLTGLVEQHNRHMSEALSASSRTMPICSQLAAERLDSKPDILCFLACLYWCNNKGLWTRVCV